MTNQEILHKAVEKAEKNGYKFPENNKCFYPIIEAEFDYPYVYYNEDFEGTWCLHINEIIFDHKFAKAFWGCEFLDVEEHYEADKLSKDIKRIGKDFVLGDYVQTWKLRFPKWQFHLREMILEKKPLKYLEKFL